MQNSILSRRGYGAALSLLLAGFLVLGLALAQIADKRIEANGYYFEKNLDVADLDFSEEWQQSCVFSNELLLYTYRTCFLLDNSFEDRERWLFRYVYARPSPIVLGGRNRDSYQFEMMSAAPTVARIYLDGTIQKS